MLLHLITSDVSAFRLLDELKQETDVRANCVVVPANRLDSKKIDAVCKEAAVRGIPVSVHQLRSAFVDELPLADAAVSWMYSQIIKREDLARYPQGTLNMHGGHIPKYRGANVLQWAIINGETELGVTWHEMVEAVDAGTIWAEATVPIAPDATAWEVRALMIEKGIELFPLAWRNMTSKSRGRVPDPTGGQVWPVRRPEDGRIGPGLPEKRLRDLVRALCPPWPSAFVDIEGSKVPVAEVSSEPKAATIRYATAEGRDVYLSIQDQTLP